MNRTDSTTAFRPLNKREKAVIMSAAKKGRIKTDYHKVVRINSLQVSYEKMQGGFCVCVVLSLAGSDRKIYRGASRRSYKDRDNPIRGEMLAFRRAVLYSRPVVLP